MKPTKKVIIVSLQLSTITIMLILLKWMILGISLLTWMILGISLSKWMIRQQIYNNLYICISYVWKEQFNLVIITGCDHTRCIYRQNKHFMVILYYSSAAATDIDKINAVNNLVQIYYMWCTILIYISRNVNSTCSKLDIISWRTRTIELS